MSKWQNIKIFNTVVKINVEKYVEYLHVELDTTRLQTEMSKFDTTCRMLLDSGELKKKIKINLIEHIKTCFDFFEISVFLTVNQSIYQNFKIIPL